MLEVLGQTGVLEEQGAGGAGGDRVAAGASGRVGVGIACTHSCTKNGASRCDVSNVE